MCLLYVITQFNMNQFATQEFNQASHNPHFMGATKWMYLGKFNLLMEANEWIEYVNNNLANFSFKI